MTRRMAIVGLDIFVLLSLPILLRGQVSGNLRPPEVGVRPAAVGDAYSRQVNRDYASWVDDQVRALREAYESSEQNREAMRRRLAALQARSDELARGLRDRESLIAGLEADKKKLEERATELTRGLRERESQLAGLEADKKKLEERATELARGLREREAQVAGLEADKKKMEERATGLARSLRERESQLTGLEADKQKLEVRATELTRGLRERELEAVRLKADKQKLEARAAELARGLDERGSQVARLETDKKELRARLTGLAGGLRERELKLARVESEKEKLRKELEKRKLAETGGHIAGIAQEAHRRKGVVTAEYGKTDGEGRTTETMRSTGMVVPVRFGKDVRLVTHVSLLRLNDDVFDDRFRAEPRRLSHFSVALLDKEGQPNWVSRVRFFRSEQRLASLETQDSVPIVTTAFRPAPRKFLLSETAIILAADGTYYESRFASRGNYIRLTEFRPMRYGARWIKTTQRSPAQPGDIVLDHKGNLAAILVSSSVGYILPSDQRLDKELILTAKLRAKTRDPDLPEKRYLISEARALNKRIRAQRQRTSSFGR